MQIQPNSERFYQETMTQKDQSNPDESRSRQFSEKLRRKAPGQKQEPFQPMYLAQPWQLLEGGQAKTQGTGKSEKALKVQTLNQAGGVYQTAQGILERTQTGTLSMRLTNGPLAGLEIQACLQVAGIQVKLKAADKRQHDALQRCLEGIQKRVNQQTRRTIMLEVTGG
ncbi:hypothetical protein [Dongshaea marina]|uniref:hypothetical protein n=1 Tax=Dongshaea marina TaxID=2047966 RepID=UPI000D3E5DA1|nr:hypothetical protein [Dongshaea marina]